MFLSSGQRAQDKNPGVSEGDGWAWNPDTCRKSRPRLDLLKPLSQGSEPQLGCRETGAQPLAWVLALPSGLLTPCHSQPKEQEWGPQPRREAGREAWRWTRPVHTQHRRALATLSLPLTRPWLLHRPVRSLGSLLCQKSVPRPVAAAPLWGLLASPPVAGTLTPTLLRYPQSRPGARVKGGRRDPPAQAGPGSSCSWGILVPPPGRRGKS